jgi:DNA-binding MarR family transcriptional regulator
MMSERQSVVKLSADDIALLVADIYEAAGLFRRAGESIAEGEGQSQARWQVLSVISGRPLTVPQAARRLGITRQGVQRVANDLIEAGLVRLLPNPDHRGSPLLELTAGGRRTLERITERARAFHATLVPSVDAPRLAQTRHVLRVLIEAMKSG